MYLLCFIRIDVGFVESWMLVFLCFQIKYGGILFLSCLSVVSFNICYNFWTVRERDSTNDALSNDAKVNDPVTFTLTFMLFFLDFRHQGLSISQICQSFIWLYVQDKFYINWSAWCSWLFKTLILHARLSNNWAKFFICYVVSYLVLHNVSSALTVTL